MPHIRCLPDNKTVAIESGQTILEALLKADIPITNICGGQAYCSTCRIMFLEGIENCSAATESEIALTKRLNFPFHVRLACQTQLLGDHASFRRMVNDEQDINIVDHQFASGVTGNKKKVTLLVAKIQGTTGFDETNFPYDIFYTMSRYFQCLHQSVNQYGGIVNSYLDSTIIATFGIKEAEKASEGAVWAGLEMLRSLAELNEFLRQLSYQPLKLTIGIHTGEVVLVAADPNRTNLVIPVGKTVTQAQQIQLANQQANTELLVSELVYNQLSERVTVGRKGNLSLGNGEVRVYELTGIEGDAPTISQPDESSPSILKRVSAFIEKFANRRTKGR